MKRNYTSTFIGILFLAAGIVIGGNVLGLFYFRLNFDGWWTIFLIAPALLSIASGGLNFGNGTLFVIGVTLLLEAQGVIQYWLAWRMILPIILLALGFKLLFGIDNGSKKNHRHKDDSSGAEHVSGTDHASDAEPTSSQTNNTSSYKKAAVFFSGQELKYSAESFTGASYSAMFGGLEIDMREVILSGDTVIQVTAVCGGIELILPPEVQLVLNVNPVLGGIDCKFASSQKPGAPKVILNGTVTLGGIEIH